MLTLQQKLHNAPDNERLSEAMKEYWDQHGHEPPGAMLPGWFEYGRKISGIYFLSDREFTLFVENNMELEVSELFVHLSVEDQ